MEEQIKVRVVPDDAVWDSFVAGSPHGSPFSFAAWVRIAASVQGANPVMLGVWEGDRLIAGVSFAEVSRGPLRRATTPVLTTYGGILHAGDGNGPAPSESLLLLADEKLVHHLQRHYHHTMLVQSPASADIRPFLWQGWRERVRYTYVMDASDPEALWGRMRSKVRQTINRASRSLTISDAWDSELAVRLYDGTFTDRRLDPPVPTALVRAMLDRLKGAGLADMRIARDADGAPLGVQVTVFGPQTAYLWLSGSVTGRNDADAGSLLIWDTVLRYAATHPTIDMVGANIPSVAFFKKGFGGVLTPYYVVEQYSSLLTRAAFRGYAAVRRLVSR